VLDGVVVSSAGSPLRQPVGGGGLASTAGDYGRFLRMLLNGGCSTARVCSRRDRRPDGPEPHRRRVGAGAEVGAAAQRDFTSSPTAATSGGSAS